MIPPGAGQLQSCPAEGTDKHPDKLQVTEMSGHVKLSVGDAISRNRFGETPYGAVGSWIWACFGDGVKDRVNLFMIAYAALLAVLSAVGCQTWLSGLDPFLSEKGLGHPRLNVIPGQDLTQRPLPISI